MMIKIETFAGESYVAMDVNPTNGMVTTKKYDHTGNLVEKMSCDTKRAANEYYNKWRKELLENAL